MELTEFASGMGVGMRGEKSQPQLAHLSIMLIIICPPSLLMDNLKRHCSETVPERTAGTGDEQAGQLPWVGVSYSGPGGLAEPGGPSLV